MNSCSLCGFNTDSINLYFDHIHFDNNHAQRAYRKKLIDRNNILKSRYAINRTFYQYDHQTHINYPKVSNIASDR
ncbi:hypothetical protein AYI70_g10764 [Smittium culicis]|uniref:Uncharacterized protein n=1 Tax=Smittium culicis TaxID=133412 RepID=A0A1R1X517_9FUNG|nr:hypothetical protein AYI70_g10764 [Smittium culicis]